MDNVILLGVAQFATQQIFHLRKELSTYAPRSLADGRILVKGDLSKKKESLNKEIFFWETVRSTIEKKSFLGNVVLMEVYNDEVVDQFSEEIEEEISDEDYIDFCCLLRVSAEVYRKVSHNNEIVSVFLMSNDEEPCEINVLVSCCLERK